MTGPSPARAVLALVAATLALGACSQSGQHRPGQGAASPAAAGHDASVSASPSATTTAPPAPRRLRVAPAGFRLPMAFGREAVISTGCSAFVAGGFVGGDSSIADAYRIDLRHGDVSRLPHLPVAVHDTAGGLAGRPVVVGGGNSSEQSVVQGWDGKAWKVIGHLPQARSDLVAANVAGRLVVAGGYNGTRPAEPGILSSADGSTWKVIGTLPVPVRYPTSAVARGAVWLFGGESSGAMQSAIQRIDPATGRARVVGRLPHPLGHAVAVAFGTRILLAGGRTDADTITDAMWWFDTDTGAVTKAGHLPHPLSDSAVAQCGDTSFVLGGESSSVTDRVLRITYR
ncbi:hypothetical protein [Nocardioides panacihumi]